ncbi:hypothetical protein [Sphingobium terrigena]|uniref:hypothetical protein n=1 Tax=Sphingobium terrigena TaxID=2304063 RepID=UPI001602BD43|nr:hypothetical protein [Sphingobium terrigena]
MMALVMVMARVFRGEIGRKKGGFKLTFATPRADRLQLYPFISSEVEKPRATFLDFARNERELQCGEGWKAE